MSDLRPVTLDEQIAAVLREIRLRERVYPRQVFNRKMTQKTADRELVLMQAVLETLISLRGPR